MIRPRTVSMFDSYGRWISGQELRANSNTIAITTRLLFASLGLAIAIYLFSFQTPASSPKIKEAFMSPGTDNGIACKKSNHSVDETLEKLKSILQSKGVTIFAIVDHSGEAQKAGLTMRPTKLVIFGNPKGGTPLMLASPSIAIDLPLKILIYEDAQSSVQICYNTTAYLQQRHNVPPVLLQNIAVVETLAANAAE
jgi:uncharacterized protein (DUF302 family)